MTQAEVPDYLNALDALMRAARVSQGTRGIPPDFDFDDTSESEDLERFHNTWAKLCGDKEVYQAIHFHRRQDNVGSRSFVASRILGFFFDVLETKVPDPVNAQADTSLRSCPFLGLTNAEAAGRFSVGAFQGQRAYYWNSPIGGVRNPSGRNC